MLASSSSEVLSCCHVVRSIATRVWHNTAVILVLVWMVTKIVCNEFVSFLTTTLWNKEQPRNGNTRMTHFINESTQTYWPVNQLQISFSKDDGNTSLAVITRMKKLNLTPLLVHMTRHQSTKTSSWLPIIACILWRFFNNFTLSSTLASL